MGFVAVPLKMNGVHIRLDTELTYYTSRERCGSFIAGNRMIITFYGISIEKLYRCFPDMKKVLSKSLYFSDINNNQYERRIHILSLF